MTHGLLDGGSNQYYFSCFNFNKDAIHLLNVGPTSPIRIFVTGDAHEDTFANVTVNGASFSLANSSLAAVLLLETLGDYSQNTMGSVNAFGTMFAHNGNVTIGRYSNLIGQNIDGGQVSSGV